MTSFIRFMPAYPFLTLLMVALLCLLPLKLHARQQSDSGQVVATIRPLHSLVAAVMGETGTPVLLEEAGQSMHAMQLRPSQMQVLSQSQLVFYVHEELETYLIRVAPALPATVSLAAVGTGAHIEPLRQRGGGVWETHDHHGHSHEHHHAADGTKARDWHVWLDPSHAIAMVEFIQATLSNRFPQHAKAYASNAAEVVRRLHQLDADIAKLLNPDVARPYLVFHDAYHYLEERYGVPAAGAITLNGEQAASGNNLIALRARLREGGIACIVTEPGASERLITTVTEGIKTRTTTLDPEGRSLVPGAALYETLMRQLAQHLHTCLMHTVENQSILEP